MDKRVFLILLLLLTSFCSLIPTVIAADPVIVFAEITNPDASNCNAMKRYYRFRVYVHDDDGATDISKVYLRGTDEVHATIFEVRADNLNSTPVYSIQTGANIIDLNISACNWIEDGDYGWVYFYIMFDWDCPPYGDCGIYLYMEDSSGNFDGWEQDKTNYYDIVPRLVTASLVSIDARDSVGSSNAVHGLLKYAISATGNGASNIAPPSSEFNIIHLHNSSHFSVGNDTSIDSTGYFYIPLNIPNIVQLNTYHVYIDMADNYTDGDAPDACTAEIIGDKYNVTDLWASSYYILTGENITLYAKFESLYDSHLCDGDDSITIEGLSFTYDPIEEWFLTSVGKDEPGTHYFDTLNSLFENTYDISSGQMVQNISLTWYDYQVKLYGPFYENGTTSGNTTIYVHFTDTTESFTLEGEANKNYTFRPLMIRWDLEGGATRVIYPIANNETYYIFEPFTDYGGYVFTIKDYSNVIGSQNSFLEAFETINGTKRLIVRQLIWDTVNPTTLILQKDATYEIQIRTLTGYIYNYGYFTPAVDTTRILLINEVEWGNQIHYVGADLIIEALRPSDNHIQVNYKDETAGTESIFIEICLRNNTQVWNATSTEQMIQFNWHNAVNTTGYIIKMTIEHELYGTCEYTVYIPGCKPDIPTFPDFDKLGKGLTAAFGVLLIIVPLLVFSRAHMIFGMFCTNIMAYIVTYLEILTIPYAITHVVMAFTIIWGLWEADRQ